jgi:branched-subunit amino acid transport protein AzlD
MPEPAYVAAALGVAVAVTVTLRAVPFGMRSALRDSPLVDSLGQWMPLGAITILAVYCLSSVDLGRPPYGADELVAVAATVGVHWWRRNAVLSIAAGTVAYLVMTNWLLPS